MAATPPAVAPATGRTGKLSFSSVPAGVAASSIIVWASEVSAAGWSPTAPSDTPPCAAGLHVGAGGMRSPSNNASTDRQHVRIVRGLQPM